MRDGRGMDHERFRIGDIGQKREKSETFNEFPCLPVSALYVERENRTRTFREIFLRQRVVLVPLNPGIIDKINFWVFLEVLRDFLRV